MEIRSEHYTDTVIYACDVILKNLKSALKAKLDKLDLGITSEQFVVLDTINSQTEIYQQQLSDILLKDKANTTRLVKILEKKGLIKRESGSYKNRVVNSLKVTPEGKKILTKAIPLMKKYIEEIFSNLSNKDVDTLHLMADRISQDLDF